jgi:hypothetical protein
VVKFQLRNLWSLNLFSCHPCVVQDMHFLLCWGKVTLQIEAAPVGAVLGSRRQPIILADRGLPSVVWCLRV